MLFELGDRRIWLHSDDARIEQTWLELIGPLGSSGISAESTAADFHFHLHLVKTLPPRPSGPPRFSDAVATQGDAHVLDTYAGPDGQTILHFLDGGLVHVPSAASPAPMTVRGWITRSIFDTGRFHDVILVSLAPLLRRYGSYLVHAAAVSNEQRALLLVGPSGSGKTTTALALQRAGWQLLSNDVVLLQRQRAQIAALPVPDQITLRPHTRVLLPHLAALATHPGVENTLLPPGTIATRHVLGGEWGQAAPVAAICFPQVRQPTHSRLAPLARSVALARLLEESLDCWDETTLPGHVGMLAELCEQAPSFHLGLGTDVGALSALLTPLAHAPP